MMMTSSEVRCCCCCSSNHDAEEAPTEHIAISGQQSNKRFS